MKGQAPKSNLTGEERVRPDGGSLFKKLLESAKAPKVKVIDNEAIKDAKKAAASELRAEASAIFSQVLGFELKAGETVSLSKKAEEHADRQEKAEKPQITAEHMDYFREFKSLTENKTESEATIAIRQQLDQILAELRNVKNSSDELENVFKDVAIDTPPEKPGVYHLTFFEGFLKLVLKMKDKIEDGVVYAKMFRSRKTERGYHAMAKKGGTSFTLHHDRSVATQTG